MLGEKDMKLIHNISPFIGAIADWEYEESRAASEQVEYY